MPMSSHFQHPKLASRSMRRLCGAFTIIEMLVVMTAIALLISISAPRYVQHIDRAREITLRQNLHAMRDAIDKFSADQGRYPADLPELVALKYLSELPEDPFTGSKVSWVTSAPTAALVSSMAGLAPNSASAPAVNTIAGVGDVHSGAPGKATDGTSYASW